MLVMLTKHLCSNLGIPMMMKMMMMCAVAAVSNAGSKSTYAGITPTHVPTVYVNSDEQDLLSHINTVPGFYFSLTFICAEYIS